MKLWSRGKQHDNMQAEDKPADSAEQAAAAGPDTAAGAEKPKRRRSSRGRRGRGTRANSKATSAAEGAEAPSKQTSAAAEGAEAPAKPRPKKRAPAKAKTTAAKKASTEPSSAKKTAAAADDGTSGTAAQETTKPKRRRRTKASDPSQDGRPDTEVKKASGSRPRRRRTPPRPTPPSVKKEMLVSVGVGEQQVAILEDGRPVEVYLERRGRRSIAGDIYKGVVENVLPGMEASFVDIGLERNGFLYVDEIVVEEPSGVQKSRSVPRRQSRPIHELVSRGQEILVQAVKDPMGTKGARLTTQISLPGRFLVYVPSGEGIGVSRRLDDEERDRLKALCKSMELPEGGIIVRTAAEGATETELNGDIALLRKLWATISGRAQRAEAPTLVYQESELPLRVVRDLFTRDYERLVVDHERTYRRIVGYVRRTSRELAEQIELYRAPEPLMRSKGVDEALHSTLNPRVDLPSGGYLIFDYAEALTVIDVNTGRFVGPRGRGGGARLEDTITENNLEAAKEIVRQLRLRDIGGIIVIDFIDMANQRNRTAIEEALSSELERDRTKTYVVEISPLGLVEMTRQNVTDGPREILTRSCPTCHGDGIVISDETMAIDAERALRELAARSTAEAMLVELPASIARILIGPAGRRLAELERDTGKYFAFEAEDDLPSDHLVVLSEGSVADVELRGLPVAVGDELELKLEQVHVTGDGDAIGRIGGYVVTVDGGAGRVGSTVRVRVERATRTAAYASIADGTHPKAEEPPIDAAEEAAESLADDAASTEAATGEGPKSEGPKKRARRGSRGGRRRKTPTAATEGAPETPGGPEHGEAAKDAVEPATTTTEAKAKAKPKPKSRRATTSKRRGAADSVAAEAMSREEVGVARPAPPKRRSSSGARKGAAVAKEESAGDDAKHTTPKATRRSPTSEAVPAPAAAEGQPEQPGADATPAKPKKKTRRGSRGGRSRRKTSQTATATRDNGSQAQDPGRSASNSQAPKRSPGKPGQQAATGQGATATDVAETADKRSSSPKRATAKTNPSAAVPGEGKADEPPTDKPRSRSRRRRRPAKKTVVAESGSSS